MYTLVEDPRLFEWEVPNKLPAKLSTLNMSGQSEVEFVRSISADDLRKSNAVKCI